METDVDFEGLVADEADTLHNETRYLDTQPVLPASIKTTASSCPRSDHEADYAMDTIVLNPCERTGSVSIFEPSSPTKKQTQKETSAIKVEKNNIRLKNSNDCSDGFVIESDSGEKSTHKCLVNVKSGTFLNYYNL